MAALARMFGETQGERTVKFSDFHLAPGEELESKQERHLTLEAKIVFPELEAGGSIGRTVPEAFNQMVVDDPGGTPYCRMVLNATWVNDGTPRGDVQHRLCWVLTSSTDPADMQDSLRRVEPAQRARMLVIYIPAAREPATQIRSTTATAFGRLLRGLDWGGRDETVRECLENLKSEFGQLGGVETMNTQVQAAWDSVYDGRVAANVVFEGIDTNPATLLDRLVPRFAPDDQGSDMGSAELSDGLRSLFALSLPLGLFRVGELLKSEPVGAGFTSSVADALPSLTMFAVEEPENHLAPHYLGKVVGQLSKVAESEGAQVVLSSHSPSIMARIKPDSVRYFRGGESHAVSEVRGLALPTEDSGEAFKYVREAVRGCPELYFSRLVVLAEGPSEEIVLRRMFEASGAPLDDHFVSVVPLGGRHVNHFWRLLTGLGIPYITLLDLDREKAGGGWGRINYVRQQLIKLHGAESKALEFTDGAGVTKTLADAAYDELAGRDDRSELDSMNVWMGILRRRFHVFFCSPLDLDYAMLECFPEAYRGQATDRGGPRIPADEAECSEINRTRMRHVLAADSTTALPELGSSYTAAQVELFAWYKYFFVDGSKPVAHMRAMVALEETDWLDHAPEVLKAVLRDAQELVTVEPVLVS
jgi:putative ATP-dependent endonuclease of OLD family